MSVIKSLASSFGQSGLWMVEPRRFNDALQLMKAQGPKHESAHIKAQVEKEPSEERSFDIQNGVAILPIQDFMFKGDDAFGGTSTILVRQQLQEANESQEVNGIMLFINSPGGFHFGTDELATDIRNSAKPVFAFIEDTGASAAFWVASQALRVFANRTAEIGSIGTVAVVEDFSKMFEEAGIKVHVVSTGDMKGAFTLGAEVTEDQLAELQKRVDEAFEFFFDAVKQGRGMTDDDLKAVADGRMFAAEEAKTLGLIDGVMSFEDAMGLLFEEVSRKQAVSKTTSRLARVRSDTTKQRLEAACHPLGGYLIGELIGGEDNAT